ncbi:MAG: fumarylacetoacetate hydrolase family protein [Bacteroidia bacterium]|nr:fumarylacetoacetate hydrolase family protein [Bacteroidia bacterium]
MKIICVGRNYAEHVKELGNQQNSEPVVFLKPDTAIPQKDMPFFYPGFSNDVHHEIEVVIKINRVGKNIAPKFANTYYDEVTVGIDFTARDLQAELKSKGLPWEISKGFDGSAIVGSFVSKSQLPALNNLEFRLLKNSMLVQHGHTSMMLFDVDTIIAYVSKFYTLKKGDLIFTGTPAGVGPVQIGDVLEGYLMDRKLLSVCIK